MVLRIGDTAPDFQALTTAGTIRFHDWIGESWALLFPHPKDFTPVCRTELGSVARLAPEFERRNVRLIALSADDVANHHRWADETEETQGAGYPVICDHDLRVSALYGMRPADTSSSRTGADIQTLGNLFLIGPDKKIKLIVEHPGPTLRNFFEVLRAVESLQLTSQDSVISPANGKPRQEVTISTRYRAVLRS
jgi:alkyl hydroperoxide reductase subunit AhpC